MENFLNLLKILSEGLGTTLLIFLLTLVLGIPAGILVAVARNSKNRIVKTLIKIYILIIRGTPMMLQIIFIYFAPYYLFKVTYDRFVAIIIAFVVNYAAYFAEIYRGGIESISKGQYEAAEVLGYSKVQTFWKIIFPQMVKRVLPPVTNEVITLVKDTSLAFALAYTEMFTLAKQVAASTASIMPLFIAGLFYYIFNFLVAMVMEKLEKRMQYFD